MKTRSFVMILISLAILVLILMALVFTFIQNQRTPMSSGSADGWQRSVLKQGTVVAYDKLRIGVVSVSSNKGTSAVISLFVPDGGQGSKQQTFEVKNDQILDFEGYKIRIDYIIYPHWTLRLFSFASGKSGVGAGSVMMSVKKSE